MSSSRFSRWSNPAEDRISALPDPILCHILSLLPTKLAVSTSILSMRWKQVWLSVFALDFDDQTFPDFAHFRHFVDSVMLSRDITLPLQSFRLKCGHCSRFDQQDINRFVNHAVQSGIENLKLNMSSTITLPPCVISCKTLTILKLKMLTVNDLPSVVDFPLLKTLNLDLVTFRCHEFLINFLSGCPVLEDLRTKCLRIIEHPRLHRGLSLHWGRSSEGKVKSLANLVRANISNLHIPFTLLYKAESLRVELNYLYFPHDLAFYKLTQLELVFASKRSHSHWRWKWLVELFKHCPKLQNLTLHEDCTYEDDRIYYEQEHWTDPQIVPECLSSQLRTCLLKDYKGTKCELQFAKYIMQNSKVLHTMTIQSTNSVDIYVKYEMLMKLSLSPRGSATCKLLFD